MPEKINKLTDAQIAMFPEWVDKWVKIGLSTEPMNFEEAKRGVLGCYKATNLKPPKVIIRMDSPYYGAIGFICTLELLKYMKTCDRSQVESQVESQVRSQVESQVRSQVESQVRSQVESQVRSQVESQVWSQVESQVEWQVEWQVRSQVESQVRSQVRSQIFQNIRCGNLWSSWYSYISFFRDVCEWSNQSLNSFQFDELQALNSSWVYYHNDFAIICDRPEILNRNHLGQLHCEDGPSMKYRDGWSLWHINGVSVPETVVLRPELQTLDEIESENNSEIKRIRIERFGWSRYLTETNAEVVDYGKNYVEGTQECLMKTRDGTKILVCACPSTGRIYTMRVPREIENRENAQLWLSGKDKLNLLGAS